MKANLETFLDPQIAEVRHYRFSGGNYVCTIGEGNDPVTDQVLIDSAIVNRFLAALNRSLDKGILSQILRSRLRFASLDLEAFSDLPADAKSRYIDNLRRLTPRHKRYIWSQEILDYLDGDRTDEPAYNEEILLYCLDAAEKSQITK